MLTEKEGLVQYVFGTDRMNEMTFEQFLALHHPAVDGPYKPSDGATAFMSRWFAWWDDPGKLSALAMIQYGVLGQRLCDDPMVAPKWFVSNSGMDIFPQAFEQRIIEIIRQQRAASGGSEEASATNPFLDIQGIMVGDITDIKGSFAFKPPQDPIKSNDSSVGIFNGGGSHA